KPYFFFYFLFDILIFCVGGGRPRGGPHPTCFFYGHVLTVSPGAVKTDLWAGSPPEMLDQVAAGIPLQRIGTPEDIAAAVVYLCSDGAAFITGHNLVIDGGFTAVQK
ncbi:MAG: SDR family oxidoreductase, partial [Synechococcales bacterium]|nr:SDR family oxidoreductase [Synechococcales bacterium]